MHWLPIVFLIVAVVLLVLFVILSLSFMGLYLSELGLWLSWIPLSLTIIAIPYLVEYVQGVHPRWDFFVLLVSCFLNLISYLRLMMPFYSVSFTNRRLKKAMISSLGEDYLTYIDPTIKSKFIKKVRFRFSQYFSGAHYKRIDKIIATVNDLPYRTVDETALNLNVYHPREGTKYPIIVFVHGGGWMMGSKDDKQNIRLVKRLAYMGYTVFSIDYRLAPLPKLSTLKHIPHDNPTIREMVSDVRSAIIYAKANAAQYKGDPENLFILGRSAGAHLALLTAFSCEEQYFEMEQISCSIEDSSTQGVIAFYPATDFDELYKFYNTKGAAVFKQSIYRAAGGNYEETKDLFKILSPINYVTEENAQYLPPVFLTAGKQDRIFDAYQSEELFDCLQKFGVKSVFLELPWANHGFDIVINGPGGQLIFQYMSQFLAWVITQNRLGEIKETAEKENLVEQFTKRRFSIICDIIRGRSNKEIEQKLKSE